MAYTIAAIGSDEELAQKWIDHDDPTRIFHSIRALTRDGLSTLGAPSPEALEAQAAVEYRVYRQLCMAKHANPLFQQQFGHVTDGSDVFAINGPDTSEQAIRAAWFALEHAVALTFIALTSFTMNHLPESARRKVRPLIDEIGAARKQLEAEAKERWGTQDPFPGKWGT